MVRYITTGLLIATLLGSAAAATIYAPLMMAHGRVAAVDSGGAQHACCPKFHALLPRALPLPETPGGDEHRCCLLRGQDAVPALVPELQGPQAAGAAHVPGTLIRPAGADFLLERKASYEFRSYSELSMIARN